MKKIRAYIRLLYFAGYTVLRVAQITISRLVLGENLNRSMRIRKSWARHLLPAIGVQIRTSGTPPDFPCILMGNHRSYLDPIILISEVNAYPVSKAEVSTWPVIGFGAKLSGVLFLKRESESSRKLTLKGIAEKLQAGFPVILFPEGTTHSFPTTIPFKSGGFKLAATERVPIVPVAIDFSSTKDHWIGNDSFLPHFLRRFGESRMLVQVRYGNPIWGEDPKVMLEMARNWIDSELLDMHHKWN